MLLPVAHGAARVGFGLERTPLMMKIAVKMQTWKRRKVLERSSRAMARRTDPTRSASLKSLVRVLSASCVRFIIRIRSRRDRVATEGEGIWRFLGLGSSRT